MLGWHLLFSYICSFHLLVASYDQITFLANPGILLIASSMEAHWQLQAPMQRTHLDWYRRGEHLPWACIWQG